jgi:protein TonB
MIVSSRIAQGAAFLIAIGVHAGVSMGLAPEASIVEMDSGQGAAVTAIGTSFADVAKGVMTAQPVTEHVTLAKVPVPTPIVHSVHVVETRVTPVHAPVHVIAKTLTKPQVAIVATRPMIETTIMGAAPPAPTSVPKISPKPRPDRPEPKIKPKPKVAEAKSVQQPKGNAAQNAKAGATNGQAQAKAKAQGTATGRSKASGNAAVSNYPGKVMRKLARAQKIRGAGKARVSFKIASNGGLASTSLRNSSGSPAFDKAALRAVQRAAPFPPPPAGAERSFSILISGI